MKKVALAAAILGCVLPCYSAAAEKYTGPRPPQPDIPYLVHASTLVATEVVQAQRQEKKNETLYVIAGPASSARTPLAEPIFLMESEKISPEKLELWRLETNKNQREIELPNKPKRDSPRPLRVNVTRIDGKLYRIEAAQTLEIGEYSLSPTDSDQAFCFSVY